MKDETDPRVVARVRRALRQQAEEQIAAFQREVPELLRRGDAVIQNGVRTECEINELRTAAEVHILYAAEVEADPQTWRMLRSLRSRLEQREGLTAEQALSRIGRMLADPRATSEVSTRDLAIAGAADRWGRPLVRRALRISAAQLRKVISRARKPSHNK